MMPTIDTPAAFLQFLHGDAQTGTLFIATKSRETGPNAFTSRAFSVGDLTAAAAFVDAICAREETYITPALFVGTRRTQNAVQGTRWLWRDGDDHPLGRTLPTPTIVIETSPGRTQEWWRLVAPIAPAQAEDLVRRIAFATGCGFQAVAANQVLRIPGTINHGVGKNRAAVRVRVQAFNPHALYGPGSFARLPAAPTLPTQAVSAMPLALDGNGAALWATAKPRLSERMQVLARGNQGVLADGTRYPSESEADQALITALIGSGLDPNDAAAAFLATPRGRALIRRKGGKDRDVRLARMLTRAQGYTSTQPTYVRPPRFPLPAAAVAAMPALGLETLAVATALASFGPTPCPAVPTLAKMLMLSTGNARAGIKQLEKARLLTSAGRLNSSRVYAFTADTVPPLSVPRCVIEAGAALGAEGVAIGVILVAQPTAQSAEEIGTRLDMRPTRVAAILRALPYARETLNS